MPNHSRGVCLAFVATIAAFLAPDVPPTVSFRRCPTATTTMAVSAPVPVDRLEVASEDPLNLAQFRCDQPIGKPSTNNADLRVAAFISRRHSIRNGTPNMTVAHRRSRRYHAGDVSSIETSSLARVVWFPFHARFS
jgi:hypothetical protein